MTQAIPAELLECALRLPADDRLALATESFESEKGPEDPKWGPSWGAELDRRLKELDAGTVKTSPWEQVKSEMLQSLRTK